jgi:hypothetical protein
MITVGGTTAIKARIQIPSRGVWWCDLELPEDEALSGAVEVEVLDATLRGTVIAGGAAQGRSSWRIAGGAGRWGEVIPAKYYVNDAGVSKTLIAQDAAKACGEQIDVSGLDGTLGTSYVRPRDSASVALDAVAPHTWRVDFDGTTLVDVASLAADQAVVLELDAPRMGEQPHHGVVVISPDRIAHIQPGMSLDGKIITDIEHRIDAKDGARTTLYLADDAKPRRSNAIEKAVRRMLPELRYSGVYEYRIVVQGGERLSLQPVRSSIGLPDIRRAKVRMGTPGIRADHRLGSIVLLAFVNADPTKPVVVGFDDPESPGFLPTRLEIDANVEVGLGDGIRLGVARMTDAVQAGPFAGAIVGGSMKVRAG